MGPRSSRKKKNIFQKMFRWFKQLNKVKKVALITVTVLIISTVSVGAWYYNHLTDLDSVFSGVNWPSIVGAEEQPSDPNITDQFEGKILNVLIMGFDRNEARDEIYVVFRPDVLMLAAINLETAEMDIISIPRDTLVPIYNRRGGKDKINHAYYYGWDYRLTSAKWDDEEERHRLGIQSQVETVSIALKGVPIHYYISVDMESVRELVDEVGGVTYDVESDVYAHNGRLLLKKGPQKLNGRDFLYYVRNRRYNDGDYQRVQNQQNILIAAFNQFKSTDVLLRSPQIFLAMRNKIETNLNLDQVAALAIFAARKISPGNIETHVLQGTYGIGRITTTQRQSNIYYLIDQKSRVKLVQDVWGIAVYADAKDTLYPPLTPEELAALNGESDAGPPVEGNPLEDFGGEEPGIGGSTIDDPPGEPDPPSGQDEEGTEDPDDDSNPEG